MCGIAGAIDLTGAREFSPQRLLSMTVAIAASVTALFFLRQAQLGIRNLIISTILMGTGIVAMHYTGMFAMQMSPPIRYDPFLFAASVLIVGIQIFFSSFLLSILGLRRR